jgi:hypothetical protein
MKNKPCSIAWSFWKNLQRLCVFGLSNSSPPCFPKPSAARLASRGNAMFIVKWIVRYKERFPVETEESLLADIDAVVEACQSRLYDMRRNHVTSPPDGFIVFDSRGNELRRWLGPLTHEGQDF